MWQPILRGRGAEVIEMWYITNMKHFRELKYEIRQVVAEFTSVGKNIILSFNL